MGPFVVAVSLPGAEAQLSRLDAYLLGDGGWRVLVAEPQLRIFGITARPIPLQRLGLDGWILGSIFTRSGNPAALASFNGERTPTQCASRLCDHYWGRYVALLQCAGSELAAYRDPSGAVDCLLLQHQGLQIAASTLPPALLDYVGRSLAIDWRGVARGLQYTGAFSADVPFVGLHGVTPGALAGFQGRTVTETQLWRPSAFVSGRPPDAPDLEAKVRMTVDRCIGALAKVSGPILMEASGGLDSSVVAATLARCGAPVRAWLNHVTTDPAGDERDYAQALMDHIGGTLTVRHRHEDEVSATALSASATGLRPSINALDQQHDEDVLAAADAVGATSIFTGHGGDGLFFVTPLPSIAADLRRRAGLGALFSSELGDLARWTRRSGWSLISLGLADRLPERWAGGVYAPWLVGAADHPGPPHPWLEGLDRLGPAKRHHVEELVLTLMFGGASRRTERCDVVHPLLSQPVLELCLSVPIDRLVQGGRDRALARRAFSDRLPEKIWSRRSKGELGASAGRRITAGLPSLRPFLLDGVLVGQGLLDRNQLESVLDPAHLAQHGGYIDLLRTAAVEGWARHWSERLRGLHRVAAVESQCAVEEGQDAVEISPDV